MEESGLIKKVGKPYVFVENYPAVGMGSAFGCLVEEPAYDGQDAYELGDGDILTVEMLSAYDARYLTDTQICYMLSSYMRREGKATLCLD